MLAPNTPSTEFRILEGVKVESYARQLFPSCLSIAHNLPFSEILVQSHEYLQHPTTPICNAILSAQDLIAETDILLPVDDQFDLYEVKSSTNPKPEHFPDIDFQRLVAKKQGIRIRKCQLILINSKYVRHGEVDPKQLFKVGDVTEVIQDYDENKVDALAKHALETCKQKTCPDPQIGLQCADDCPLRDVCWAKVDAAENNIFSLYRLPSKRAWGWFEQGIVKNTDIPTDYPLNVKQKIQVKAEETGLKQLNIRGIKSFLNHLEFPLYFLDFETFASAVPLINNSSPYQPIPFQYSLHVIEKDLSEEPKHYSWIWDYEIEHDPREFLLFRLKEYLGDKGSIIAYNANYEQMILKQAVKLFPVNEEWLKNVLKRFVDLLKPFREFHIYHPKQAGSCSLKAVLPALTGKDYGALQIQDGQEASRAFMGILAGDVKDREKEKVLEHLEEYCGMDTMAMVEIVRRMKELTT